MIDRFMASNKRARPPDFPLLMLPKLSRIQAKFSMPSFERHMMAPHISYYQSLEMVIQKCREHTVFEEFFWTRLPSKLHGMGLCETSQVQLLLQPICHLYRQGMICQVSVSQLRQKHFTYTIL